MGEFADIARQCAPQIAVETIAAIASLESALKPFAIRIDTAPPLNKQPVSKAEAIETAMELIAEGHELGLGITGLDSTNLDTLDLTLADAFDICLNLKATARLLDGYYRVAFDNGVSAEAAETHMLNAFYGKGDASAGESVGYDEKIRKERDRLSSKLSQLVIDDASSLGEANGNTGADGVIDQPSSANPIGERTAKTSRAPSWDAYGSSRGSSTFVWSSPQAENP